MVQLVERKPGDRRIANSRLIRIIVMRPLAKRFIRCLLMVKPGKTGIRPNMAKLVMER